jgi:hypothetical protein
MVQKRLEPRRLLGIVESLSTMVFGTEAVAEPPLCCLLPTMVLKLFLDPTELVFH